MITGNSIRAIKYEVNIFEELKVVRLGNGGNGAMFDIFSFEDGKVTTIYTGNADGVANYLNGYFNLKM